MKEKAKITSFKSSFDRAEPAGKALLKKATEDIQKRKETGKRDTYQAAKEAATFLVNKSRGKIISFGGIGNGKSAYCSKCKSNVSYNMTENKSFCMSCKSEIIIWKDRKEENNK